MAEFQALHSSFRDHGCSDVCILVVFPKTHTVFFLDGLFGKSSAVFRAYDLYIPGYLPDVTGRVGLGRKVGDQGDESLD